MYKFKNIALFVLAIMIVGGCTDTEFKKSKGGMPYKIYRGKGTIAAKNGSVLKVHMLRKINDSTIFDTHKGLPYYIPVQEYNRPYDASEVFTLLKNGDSLVTVQLIDSFFKYDPNLQQQNPQLKKGDRLITSFKVLQVFPDQGTAQADEGKEKDKLLEGEIKTVQSYLSKNNINAQRVGRGIFVELIEPGQGASPDTGKVAMVKYKGSTFDGRIFDTNMDSSFQHTDPLPVTIGSRGSIEGFEQGVRVLKPGGHAKIYIPSMLGFGGNPDPRSGIKPYDNLIFDIYLLEVKDAPKVTQPPINIDTTQRNK